MLPWVTSGQNQGGSVARGQELPPVRAPAGGLLLHLRLHHPGCGEGGVLRWDEETLRPAPLPAHTQGEKSQLCNQHITCLGLQTGCGAGGQQGGKNVKLWNWNSSRIPYSWTRRNDEKRQRSARVPPKYTQCYKSRCRGKRQGGQEVSGPVRLPPWDRDESAAQVAGGQAGQGGQVHHLHLATVTELRETEIHGNNIDNPIPS